MFIITFEGPLKEMFLLFYTIIAQNFCIFVFFLAFPDGLKWAGFCWEKKVVAYYCEPIKHLNHNMMEVCGLFSLFY